VKYFEIKSYISDKGGKAARNTSTEEGEYLFKSCMSRSTWMTEEYLIYPVCLGVPGGGRSICIYPVKLGVPKAGGISVYIL